MADYREITQEYAKGAIKAVMLLNAGAALAILSQFSSIVTVSNSDAVKCAMIAWIVGILFGFFTWVGGYVATIEFGNYYQSREGEGPTNETAFKKGNFYTRTTTVLLFISLLLFVAGCLEILINLNI